MTSLQIQLQCGITNPILYKCVPSGLNKDSNRAFPFLWRRKLARFWALARLVLFGPGPVVAGIDAENEISIALHKKFGFVEVAHFKEVGWKFGRWLDLKFLELVLASPNPSKGGA